MKKAFRGIVPLACGLAILALIAGPVYAQESECPADPSASCACIDFNTPSGDIDVTFQNWFVLNQNATFSAPWSPTRVLVLNPIGGSPYCGETSDDADASGTITFVSPVAEVNFWYASCWEVTFEAFDSSGALIEERIFPATETDGDEFFGNWGRIEFVSPSGECDIAQIRVTGLRKIDGLEFCCAPDEFHPDVEITKVCEPQSDNINHVSIDVENTGDTELVNCTVTDILFDDPSCEGDFDVIGEQIIDSLLPGESATIEFQIEGLTADSCNKATVVCDVPANGGTVDDMDNDLCESGAGCLTRTGGFWGNRPGIANMFLPVESCGLTVDNALPATPVSSTEDICVNNGEAREAGTSMQQLQLIRACTVAALNFAATAEGGGSCSSHTDDILDLLDYCCDDMCTAGERGQVISRSNCIEMVNDFNESNDTMPPFGPFVDPGSAAPEFCNEADSNDWVNPGRNLGPGHRNRSRLNLSRPVIEERVTDEASSTFGAK